MRTMLFFDLPMVSKSELREYRHFIKFIKSKGFIMMQESVYTKLSLNESVVESTLKEIRAKLPKDGIVSVLTITEKQFSSIISNFSGRHTIYKCLHFQKAHFPKYSSYELSSKKTF